MYRIVYNQISILTYQKKSYLELLKIKQQNKQQGKYSDTPTHDSS